MMWNCPIEEDRQRHQRQKGLPGGSLFVHLLMLQYIIPDFLSCALARHDGFPKDVARAPGSQELTSLCWRLTGRLVTDLHLLVELSRALEAHRSGPCFGVGPLTMPLVFVIWTVRQEVTSLRPSGQSLGILLDLTFSLRPVSSENDDDCLAMDMWGLSGGPEGASFGKTLFHLSAGHWRLSLWHCVHPLFARLSSVFLLVSKFS